MKAPENIWLVFQAQVRAGECLEPEPKGSHCMDPVLVEHNKFIVIVVDAFQEGPFTKLILSKN